MPLDDTCVKDPPPQQKRETLTGQNGAPVHVAAEVLLHGDAQGLAITATKRSRSAIFLYLPHACRPCEMPAALLSVPSSASVARIRDDRLEELGKPVTFGAHKRLSPGEPPRHVRFPSIADLPSAARLHCSPGEQRPGIPRMAFFALFFACRPCRERHRNLIPDNSGGRRR